MTTGCVLHQSPLRPQTPLRFIQQFRPRSGQRVRPHGRLLVRRILVRPRIRLYFLDPLSALHQVLATLSPVSLPYFIQRFRLVQIFLRVLPRSRPLDLRRIPRRRTLRRALR